MPKNDLQRKLRNIPSRPGVYLFRDASGKVLYVGKAKRLSARVRSYFRKGAGAKSRALLKQASDLDYLVLSNEVEALLAENNLIKEHRPRYNVRLRDDKTYPYLRITYEEELPRIFLTRQVVDSGSAYLGPYTEVGVLKQMLRVLKSMFPIRDCPGDLKPESLERECLYFHIGRCLGPCTGRQSKEDYRRDIRRIELYLRGKSSSLRKELEGAMVSASAEMDYETAARIRDNISALDHLETEQSAEVYGSGDRDVLAMARDRSEACGVVLRIRHGKLLASETYRLHSREEDDDDAVFLAFLQQYYDRDIRLPEQVFCARLPEEKAILERWLSDRRGAGVSIRVPQRGLGRRLLGMARDNAISKLEERLAGTLGKPGRVPVEVFELRDLLELKGLPRHIIGVDISNMGEREVVGSLVSFRDGKPFKSGYRRFRMREVEGQDDYASIREVVGRYFKRTEEKLEAVPDLLLVDGGPGQLAAAQSALKMLGIEIPLISLAKREEEIYRAGRPDQALVLAPTSMALKLLQGVRDEAHRFAVSYHRKARGRRSMSSALDSIPGLGPRKRKALIAEFGSVSAVAAASEADLRRVPGIGQTLAATILGKLKDEA